MKAGEDVRIRTFGTFYNQQRKAREVRNPQDGTKIQVPAKRYPRFRSSKVFREFINK